VVRASGVRDTTLSATATLTDPGPFALPDVTPGVYRVTAFYDWDGDGEWGEYVGEPATRTEDGITVRRGEETGGVRLMWRAAVDTTGAAEADSASVGADEPDAGTAADAAAEPRAVPSDENAE
jgi:hypothetical protein